jgi:hypothetical protein
MNYIWDVPIQAKHQQVDLSEVTFAFSEDSSPYMELSPKFLNQTELPTRIDVNPYFRLFSIFKSLFDANYAKYPELREVLFDILLHFLAQVDVNQGLEKVEFYKRFIHEDIKRGLLGQEVKQGFEHFTLAEKSILLDNIYKFYKLGKHLFFLRRTVKQIFRRVIFYTKCGRQNRVVLFINRPVSSRNRQKLKLIKELFLPLNFELDAYWQHHFGVVGVRKTMQIGNISVYWEGS